MRTLVLDYKKLSSHVSYNGDTGVGKSQFLAAMMREVERTGGVGIVWDPNRQYVQKFRNIERGDWVLDVSSTEIPYWDARREYRDEGEAFTLSKCFMPDSPGAKDPFWNNAASGLFTVLLAHHHPTIRDIGLWCANDEMIDERVKGTEYERILTHNAAGMRASIIAHLNLIAQPLRMMPQYPEGRRTFSVRDYCEKRNSWVFITSAPQYTKIMTPLNGFFLSAFVQRLIAAGKRKDLPRVYIFFEEASTLTIDEFHTALVRLRNADVPVIYAIQNPSDFKAAYGDRWRTISSQAYYKVFGRLGEGESAKAASETIGQKLVRKMRETWQEPRFGMGIYRKTFTFQPESVPVVPEYTLQNIDDLEGCAIRPGRISYFKLPIVVMPDRPPLLQERMIPPIIRQEPEPMVKLQPEHSDDRVTIVPGANLF